MDNAIHLGVSTAAFFPRPLDEIFLILRQQPLRCIELMPQSPAECQPGFAAELVRVAGEGFVFPSIHFPLILEPFLFNPYPSAREFGRELCRGLAQLAAALGSTVIVVHSPPRRMSRASFLQVARENTAYLCELCSHQGVKVALENTASGPIQSPGQMQEWSESIGHPNLTFALDTTHAHQAGLDPLAFLVSLPRLAHIHASDYLSQQGAHQPPGTGEVSWSRLAQALLQRGFQGHIILELSTKTIGENPVQTLQESASFLMSVFDCPLNESEDET